MIERHDVIIVGAGPAGLAAGIYAGRARFKTLILEKGVPGGQILLTDWVENYPGFPDGIAPFDLIDGFRKQAERFGARIEADEVLALERRDGLWHLTAGRGEYAARAVLIATGSVYRKLGLADEARLTGKGVSFCATCDGAFFTGKDVAVVGGGDNALTEALFLTKFASKVFIIHRRNRLRGEKILQERILAHEKILVLWDCVVEAIRGGDRLESLTVLNLKENRRFPLPVGGLFVSIGTDPVTGFVKGLVEFNEWGQVKVDISMATSQPGLFAAGDVSDACPKQVATAVGTGVHAALSIEDYLERL